MSAPAALPDIGLAITTIGRPALAELLASAAASSWPPVAVAIADQSGGRLADAVHVGEHPFAVVVTPSGGGVGAGRNDAVAALPAGVDVVGFPNDDSVLGPDLLASVARLFATRPDVAAVACTYRVPDRSALPPDGTHLDRRSVWRAAEPALFVRRAAVDAAGGFRAELGAGAPTPWQSGEGTDLLLRVLATGATVLSAASLEVSGPGERRDLDDAQFVAKARRYARGTGRVYRLHGYPVRDLARTVVGPWLSLLRSVARGRVRLLDLRLAGARSLGRLEGMVRPVSGRTAPPPPVR